MSVTPSSIRETTVAAGFVTIPTIVNVTPIIVGQMATVSLATETTPVIVVALAFIEPTGSKFETVVTSVCASVCSVF